MRIIIKIFLTIIAFSFSNAFAYTTAPQAIVYDMESKKILFEKDSNRLMYPASMTKIMTAYVVFDAIKSGNITMDTKFPISKKSWKKGGSKMFLKFGVNVSVKNLLYGVIIQSGNDAAIALAEGIAGSEENFAQLMNSYAKKLGLKNTNFKNATGWPDKEHYTTSKDLIKLSVSLIRDFPEHYHIWGIKEFTYNKIKQQNRNPLLYKNIGADGLKTGHTELSGYGLVGSVKKGDRRVLFVLNGMRSKKERSRESFKITQEFLFNYKNLTVLKFGAKLADAPVFMGTEKTVPIITKNNYVVPIRIGSEKNIKAKIIYNSPLIAPVAKGVKIGVVKITQVGKKDITLPIYAGADIKKIGMVQRFLHNLKNMF